MDGFMVAESIKESPVLAKATIMMLTSGGHAKDVARCRELGIVSYLTKPIRQSDLLNAIITALYSTPPPTRESAPPASIPTKLSAALHILLVEDNPVNQLLAVRMLEKRGHSVVVAHHGREALTLLEKEAFAVVLMDVQMPEMDGFAATRAIRQQEESTGSHIPIVALTAHAMRGTGNVASRREWMPIFQPLQAHQLFEVIERLVLSTPMQRREEGGEENIQGCL
jgi:CheY-like chemotaxis protein